MNFLNVLTKFFSVQDWRLIGAGLIMILIFILMVSLVSFIVISYLKRKEAVNISLPDINTYGLDSKEVKPQFTEPSILELELVPPERDVINPEEMKDNDDLFLTALTIETGKYIPKSSSYVTMPEISEKIDYEKIKQQKEQEAKDRQKQELERLKEIARADEEQVTHENTNDIGGALID